MDMITTRPDGTGSARMHSLSLERDFTFEFSFDPRGSDMDIAHAAALQLVVEEQAEIGRQ